MLRRVGAAKHCYLKPLDPQSEFQNTWDAYHSKVAGTEQSGTQRIDQQMKPNAQPVHLGTVALVQNCVSVLRLPVMCSAVEYKSHIEEQNNQTCYESQENSKFPPLEPGIVTAEFEYASFLRPAIAM
jgi:hypothetical protein